MLIESDEIIHLNNYLRENYGVISDIIGFQSDLNQETNKLKHELQPLNKNISTKWPWTRANKVHKLFTFVISCLIIELSSHVVYIDGLCFADVMMLRAQV